MGLSVYLRNREREPMGLKNGGLCGRGQTRSDGRQCVWTSQLEGKGEFCFRGSRKPLKTLLKGVIWSDLLLLFVCWRERV